MGLENYINKHYKKVIGWGTGSFFDNMTQKIPITLDYLIDNDIVKQGKILKGRIIYSPEVLSSENQEEVLIVIYSSFFQEIIEDINCLGDFSYIYAEDLINLDLYLNSCEYNYTDTILYEGNNVITISGKNFLYYIDGTNKLIHEQMITLRKVGYNHIHLLWKRFNIKGFKGLHFILIINGTKVVFLKKNEILNLKSPSRVIVHSLANLDLQELYLILRRLPSESTIYYYLHDFSSVCKNVKLMHNNRYFCLPHNNNWNLCEFCEYGHERQRIYSFHENLFSKENVQLISPSQIMKNYIKRIYKVKDDRITVAPHQTYKLSSKNKSGRYNNEKIKIAYVGYKHQHKGWGVFKQLTKDFGTKYDFYCFGYSDEVLSNVKYVDVSFIKDGELAMVNKLKEYSIDIALLWSTTLETYSYTYYESSAAGLFILTNDLSGNIKDQVILNKNGKVLADYYELSTLLRNQNKVKELVENNLIIFEELKQNKAGFLNLIEENG